MLRLPTFLLPLAAAVVLVAAGCAPTSSPPDNAPVVEEAPEPEYTPPPDPADEPATGILAISGGTAPIGSSAYSDIVITSIDPATGAATEVRRFPVQNVQPALSFFTPIFTRMSFDPNLDRLAATFIVASDNSRHVGWIEKQTGRFVDVSEIVAPSAGGFTGVLDHGTPAFGPDGAFYFTDDVEKLVYKVASAHPTAATDAVVALDYATEYSDPVSLWIYPSGTVDVAYGGWIPQVENTTVGATGQGRVEDYVSATTMITGDADNGNLWLSDFVSNSAGGYLGSGTGVNRISLLPERVGRLSWNPVISPDSSEVVFLSAPEAGDSGASLFVVPITGGEPAPMSTDYSFAALTGGGFFGPSSYVQIFDWR